LLLGIPVAAWGLLLYAALTVIAVSVRDTRLSSRLALAVSGSGLAVSLYLTAVSAIELSAVCAWCVASLGAVTACFAIAAVQARRSVENRTFRRDIAGISFVAGLLLTGLHAYYDTRVAQAPRYDGSELRGLALHLRATGARFYGASWCYACKEQRALFGDAASLLPYVECEPEGSRGVQAPPCRVVGIARYPTWIVAGHRHEGLLEVDRLAALSEFEGSKPARSQSGDAGLNRSD
jgi:hypothetical protein